MATNEYKTCQQPWEVDDEERFRTSVCALIEQPDEKSGGGGGGGVANISPYGFICFVEYLNIFRKFFELISQ